MEAVKMFFFLVAVLLTFSKCAVSSTYFGSLADLLNVGTDSVGPISDQCLRCICNAESNCQARRCKMDVGSLSCGYFQIKEPYYQDCGRPGQDWKTCAKDYSCAETCVRNYMARYGPRSGCPETCETYARIHNGGPRGCKRSNTLTYWQRVQSFGC
ncbi:hypothetical protein ACJMK2_026272 [Sinanodonta woodiana]|uniref:lysozyme n=1 Tax=Sinanodonta woodiana TaxID=1069815 RepID=A0ABD3XJI8_SINWO